MKAEKSQQGVLKYWEMISTVLWLLALIILTLFFLLFQKVNIHGSSMENNFFQNQSLIVNRYQKNLKRGQVVTFYSSLDKLQATSKLQQWLPIFSSRDNKILLKRVIGLPGESIEVIGSTVIIYNQQYPEGRVLVENYLNQEIVKKANNPLLNTNYYSPKITLSESQYFIMGDNRPVSSDSRDSRYGPFEKEALFGTVSLRYWPLSELKNVEIGDYSFRIVNDSDMQKFENIKQ